MLDCVIVGAGAAGLAAARQLTKHGKRCLVLEARDRIGGRIHSDYSLADFPIELGAEFIHGEGASTHALLAEAGLATIPVDRYGKLRWGSAHSLLETLPTELSATLEGLKNSYQQLGTTALSEDLSLATYLEAKGWTKADLEIADVLLAQTCCASIYGLSAADLQREMKNDTAGGLEFRIREGYGALLRHLGKNLTIQLNKAVVEIQQMEQGIKLRCQDSSYEAKTCIVTLPLSLLQREIISFRPELSQTKRKAIRALKMEAGTKLIYGFQQSFWDDDLTYLLHTGVLARWWTPEYGRGKSRVISAFVTADRATKIDKMSELAALELGLYELSKLLDLSIKQLRDNLSFAKRICWMNDPWSRGAYAHVPVGVAEARVDLAKPEGRIFFAGEACAYFSNPQTVHGAFDSGILASEQCLNSLD
ncbi:MAG: FAD-dependent oxidoreductase [Trueperaceae bacterium]|nr:FAD-dependent oxidoreductase [Trueperaceae bacterium]